VRLTAKTTFGRDGANLEEDMARLDGVGWGKFRVCSVYFDDKDSWHERSRMACIDILANKYAMMGIHGTSMMGLL
jgi:hypothetical protein